MLSRFLASISEAQNGGAQVAGAVTVLVVPAVALAVWKILGSAVRSMLVSKLTVMDDLKNLGKARADGKRIKGTAVICGGR